MNIFDKVVEKIWRLVQKHSKIAEKSFDFRSFSLVFYEKKSIFYFIFPLGTAKIFPMGNGDSKSLFPQGFPRVGIPRVQTLLKRVDRRESTGE